MECPTIAPTFQDALQRVILARGQDAYKDLELIELSKGYRKKM